MFIVFFGLGLFIFYKYKLFVYVFLKCVLILIFIVFVRLGNLNVEIINDVFSENLSSLDIYFYV